MVKCMSQGEMASVTAWISMNVPPFNIFKTKYSIASMHFISMIQMSRSTLSRGDGDWFSGSMC